MARPEAITTLEGAQEYRKQEASYLKRASRTGAQEYLGMLRQDPLYQQARGLVVFNRWEHIAQKTPEFSPQTWEDAAGILSAGCNNGVKARLWIEIAQTTTPQTYISVNDLYERYKTIFAGSSLLEKAGTNAKANMVDYCQDSLCEVGLVAAEVNLAGKVVGFGITSGGQKFLDAAYLTLWFEQNNNQSLYPVLGPTSSSGDTRAPLNRAKILDYLMRRPSKVREADLVITYLQLANELTGEHLKLLAKLGLIDYKTINSHHRVKTPLQYEIQEGRDLHEARYFTTSPRLQDEVIRAISPPATSSLRFSIADIVNRLPDEIKSRWNVISLSKYVSQILSGFAKEGYLSRVDNFKGREKQSDANMTSKGRSFVLSFIWPALSIVEARALTEGQRVRISLARENFDSFARTSAELYYPYSQSAKIRAKKEHLGKCIELLLDAKEPLTAWDLAEKLGLSAATIHGYLRPKIKSSDRAVINTGGEKITIERKSVEGLYYYSVLSIEPAS